MENTKKSNSQGEIDLSPQVPQVAIKEFYGHRPNAYYFNHPTALIVYLIEKKMFYNTLDDSSVTTNDVLRYIKGLYPDKETFERDEFSFIKKDNEDYRKNYGGDGILDELISILEGYDDCEPFTLEEASEIKNAEFKTNVLSTIAA